MSKIVLFTNLSLDGVMQAPGRADEDRRGGFKHGGWGAPYAAMQESGDTMANVSALLFGRLTYEDFYASWAHQTDNPFTEFFNNIQKYVASRTLKEPLVWVKSTLLKGDVMQAVARLREEPGKDIVVFGSGKLAQSLMKDNLIDKYVLLVHPLVLGSGSRLFAEGSPFTSLRLANSATTSTGVVRLTYTPA